MCSFVGSYFHNLTAGLMMSQNKTLQYDFLDNDNDAFPERHLGRLEIHGTNCAGEIAMEKGNTRCGVGVAYNSFITG